MADEPKYSPRYVAYASEHGRSPEQQLEHDREAWPGGLMCGFILWSNERLAEYAKINPAAFFTGIRTTRSEEHTSELQSLMRISYAVFCLKKKIKTITIDSHNNREHPKRHESK